MPRRTPAPIRYVAVAADRFIQQQMATYAAALAYRGLLALFPFVIFITALVNALDVWRLFGMLAEWARTAPEGRVPAAIREWIVFQARSRAEGAVLSVSAVAAAWAVASGARVLRTALNTAGNLSEVQPPLIRLIMSLVAAPVLGAAILAIVTLFTVTRRFLLRLAAWFDVNDIVLALWDGLRVPAGLILASVVIAAIYRFAASHRQPYKALLPGAAFAAVTWAAASLIFSEAVSRMLQFGVTYGSFTAAIVLLVYLYLAAAGLLFGAELNTARASAAEPEHDRARKNDGTTARAS